MQETLDITEMPAAMSLLKDWSVWLVGIQVGALGLVSFIVGEGGFPSFTNWLAKIAAGLAIMCFASSIVSATFLLGQLPDVRRRMTSLDDNFYTMPAWEGSQISLANLATAEHWLFMVAIFLFGLALLLELAKKIIASLKKYLFE